ncbi:hypothetical protein LBMAG57_37460 [Verrucomicrobiota bacterium]|nr:hypothetical protein LBMAG57_37460 [Verrucomicrobiota bacterium]
MSDQSTPQTDAIFTDNVPEDAQIVAFCERLERDLNAARAERDELNRQLSVALKGKRPYSSKFADETIASQVKRITELEEKLNGWFSDLNAARAERDELAKERDDANALSLNLCADRDGDAKDRDDEIAVLRADVARLRTALEGIAEYGKLCNDGDATDCERLIYLAKQAINTPAQ